MGDVQRCTIVKKEKKRNGLESRSAADLNPTTQITEMEKATFLLLLLLLFPFFLLLMFLLLR